jgi:hypothetical protein
MSCGGNVVAPFDHTITSCQQFFALPWLPKGERYQGPLDYGLFHALLATNPQLAHPASGWRAVQEFPSGLK